MILKRVIVTNWRSLLNRTEVGPFSEGLNVIHAPNGTGKSSLFEALRRGLFDAHHVSGIEIAAVQPWGRDLTPSVEIEFTEGEETWRVEKSFLSGKSAKLSRLEDGTFEPVADSRKADERILGILSAVAPGRGLSKQEHWGLAQILWAPQNELHLDRISGDASERIKAALGVQIAGGSGSQIEKSINEKYQKFFTKNGSYKGGQNAAPIVLLEQERDDISEKLSAIRENHLACEQARHDVEDARQRRLQARREADALRDTVITTRARAEEYRKLKQEQSIKREAESLAKERYDSLTNIQKQITDITEQIDQLTRSTQEKESNLEELKKEREAARETINSSRSLRERARGERNKISERQALIESAEEYQKHYSRLAGINQRFTRINQLIQQQNKSKQLLDAILAPDTRTIHDLRNLLNQRNQAEASLVASQIHLTITPNDAIEVKNTANNSTSNVKASQTFSASGDDWVDVSVLGFGSIRASGPENNSENHRAALAEAQSKIRILTQPYGTDDPEKLQNLRNQADKLENDISGFENRINDLLAGDGLNDLKKESGELKARINQAEKTYPEWKDENPNVGELRSEFETFKKEIEDFIQNTEDAYDKAQSVFEAADRNVNDERTKLGNLKGRLEAMSHQLETLLIDAPSEGEREEAISETLMNWQAAKALAEEKEKALAQYPDDPQKELDILENQLKALEEEETNARDREKTSEGQLQSLAAEGTYSELVKAEEQLIALDNHIEQESIRMDAIRLLNETIENHKSHMIASVSAPVERIATRMLSRIVGPRLGQMKLNEDFVPQKVIPDIVNDEVALHNLSGGEQEQLYLVARLALADVLAKDHKQLVVLDDVLNATDSGRLARLLSLIEEASERLQIIILTCHPERYRALEKAEFFELRKG